MIKKIAVYSALSLMLSLAIAPHAFAGTTTDPLWARTIYTDAGGDVKSIATDSQDNVYVLGEVAGVENINFNELGDDTKSYSAFKRVYLTRWNADGSYGWTKYLAHSGSDDRVSKVVIDGSNNVYISGCSTGTVNFNPDGSDIRTSSGAQDSFISKWSNNGTYQWTRTFGNANADCVEGLTLGPTGNIYAVGSYKGSVDFDDLGTDIRTTPGTDANSYVLSYAPDGTYRWTYSFDGLTNWATAITSDANGLYLVGGYAGQTNFDPAGAGNLRTPANGGAVYLQSLDFNGQQRWFQEFGDTQITERDITTRGGKIAISGGFYGAASFGASGAGPKTAQGSYDGFVSVWNTNGTYQWVNSFGNNDAVAYSTGIDSNGAVYAVGYFVGSNVNFNPAGSALYSSVSASDYSNVVVRYNSDGTYDWAKPSNGTTDISENWAIHFDSQGHILIGGAINCAPTACYPIPGSSTQYNTNYADAPYITKWQLNQPKQYIVNPPTGMTIVTNEGVDVTSQGVAATGNVWLTVKDLANNIPIVDVNVDLSTSRDWSLVKVGSDGVTGKAFVTGLSGSGSTGTHSLYMPKLPGQNGVIICPEATSFDGVSENCPNAIRYDITDTHVKVVDVAGKSYWLVDGLTGTGGVGVVLADTTTNGGLADTGSHVITVTALSFGLLAATGVVFSRKKNLYSLGQR